MMMAMFGWTGPRMPAHYIAQTNREKLRISGMEKSSLHSGRLPFCS